MAITSGDSNKFLTVTANSLDELFVCGLDDTSYRSYFEECCI